MFERHFQRAMKYGARLLFLVAVMLVLLGFVDGVQEVKSYARPSGGDRSTWLYHLKSFWTGLSVGWPPQTDFLQQTARALVGMSWLYTLSSGGLFLAAAVIVDRFDRWLAEGRQPPVT